ncbi:hypothetical protein ROSINTL182_09713, partial [Roseburia intestinalis L1-82]
MSASSLSMTEWTAHRGKMILPRCGTFLQRADKKCPSELNK